MCRGQRTAYGSRSPYGFFRLNSGRQALWLGPPPISWAILMLPYLYVCLFIYVETGLWSQDYLAKDVFFSKDRISPCSLDWPGTPSIDRLAKNSQRLFGLWSWMLGLKMSTTTLSLHILKFISILWLHYYYYYCFGFSPPPTTPKTGFLCVAVIVLELTL